MARGFSITSVPGFWEIAFGLGVIYGGSFIWNLNHGGLIYAFETTATSLYGVLFAVILISIIIAKLYHVLSPYRVFIE
jgi:hypothetical protein